MTSPQNPSLIRQIIFFPFGNPVKSKSNSSGRNLRNETRTGSLARIKQHLPIKRRDPKKKAVTSIPMGSGLLLLLLLLLLQLNNPTPGEICTE
jgi:hypothetical protein